MQIVDDNKADRDGIRDLVGLNALQVRAVGCIRDGAEGLNAALKPDFITVDVEMPRLDGIAMSRRLARALPDAEFIGISCFDKCEYVKGDQRHLEFPPATNWIPVPVGGGTMPFASR
jgi:YesN/AraC family two-component response regulator